MNKEELRKKFKIIRDNINNRDKKSSEIIKRLINTKEYQKSKVIALYSNISSEVETKELIKISLENKKVVLPKINKDNTMDFYEINCLKDLEVGAFNIKEPKVKNKKPIKKEEIDLIIIPGICFDKNRNRIGYGKGYYDKYLSNTNIKKIGLCYEEQITKEIKSDKTDISLDYLITEIKIY